MKFVPYWEFVQDPLHMHSSRVIHDVNVGLPAYRGSVQPSEMTFGSVTTGNQSAEQKATVTNTGFRPLPIKSIKGVGDFLVTHNCPAVLKPGEVCEIAINYAPVRAGMVSGGVYVDTGNAQGTEFIKLTGNGIASGKGSLGLSETTWNFGSVPVGSSSATKEFVLSNLGDVVLVIQSFTTTGEFSVVGSAPVSIQPGDSITITGKMTPISNGAKSGSITVNHNGNGGKVISLSGTGVATTVLPVISVSAGVLEPYLDDASVTSNVSALTFPLTEIGQESAERIVILTNDGFAGASVIAATATGEFELVAPVPTSVAPNGGSSSFKVKFKPTATGLRTGTLNIQTDATTGDVFAIGLTGTGKAASVSLPKLKIVGNQFVTVEDSTPVRLESVNWFGAEGTNYTPHGTWLRPWKGILEQIQTLGFNTVRMPFSGDFTTAGRIPPSTAIDPDANPDLVGKSALAIMDMILDYCAELGLYVVLDHHRRNAGDGADGSPIGTGYTKAQWLASWAVMANRYKNHPAVVGADVHNEPHDHNWTDWAALAEECGNSILTLAPDWLIFVEGVGQNLDGSSYWWGGALKDVATRPIVLSVANKVAYSPHEYGQSVGSQQWLAYQGQTAPVGWPDNLYAVWDSNWGYIFKDNVAPIWIGEFGGHFGVDGSGNVTKPNGTQEIQWATNLVKYLNGDFNGDGTNDLTAGKKGLSFAYWSLNPNSSDTGGLLKDDWLTTQPTKLTIINPLLT